MAKQSVDAFGQYLVSIGKIPLLTADQEKELGRQVQRWQKVLKMRKEGVSDADITAELGDIRKIERAAARARRKMVEANLRLVVSIAKKFTGRGMGIEDLVQEGALGLHRGVELFDPERGWKFSTYAYWWIRQAITRAIANDSRMVRIPIHLWERLNKIKKASKRFMQQHGRLPSIAELSELLGLPCEQIESALVSSYKTVSLNHKVRLGEDTELMDLLAIESPEDDPQVHLELSLIQEQIEESFKPLPAKHQEVLALRYGLNSGDGMTLSECGEALNLSKERVRQIQTHAVRRLRNDTKLKQFSSAGG